MDHFGEKPLIDFVEFVQVPEDFESIYRSTTHIKNQPTFQVESDTGFGVVIMNSFRNSAIRRKEIRDYIHYVIAKHRHSISQADAHTPSEDWTALNLKVEKVLLENSVMIPLYYAKRQIPFSADLMNINIKHFGYIDFSRV